ncbi:MULTISPECIES: CBS domain-containing protein [Giesbergeria]|uniref:HPP family protein n=1 Tax=Giesbergeria sinuosa TaxID=80883 RepID=A0ABV9QAG9_9BURK
MFFVFGPSGQMYRGGPENLAKISPVRGVRRPLALRTRAAGLHGEEAAPLPLPAPTTTAPARTLRAQDAVSAYTRSSGQSPPRQPLTLVRDVMTRGALTVPLSARVHEAWQMFTRYQVGQAPVLNSVGRVVGLLLRTDMGPPDLLPPNDQAAERLASARRPVAEVMVSPVPTVSEDTELRRLAGVLLETGLPGLPVTDDSGELKGFVSRTDLLRAIAADPPLDLWS